VGEALSRAWKNSAEIVPLAAVAGLRAKRPGRWRRHSAAFGAFDAKARLFCAEAHASAARRRGP
jgi:hypothetical protein